jgi:ACS family D-galactonate transporter-like MFS transporter
MTQCHEEEAVQPKTSRSAPPAEASRTTRRTRVRWGIITLAAVGTAIAYLDRANLGVAAPFIEKELGLDPAAKGLLLSVFFWTYAVFQLPSGWLVDRLGPRVMFAAAAIWWSVFTSATALARGLGSLVGLRMALGIGEAPMMAANAKTVSEWFPRRERAFASSIFDTGSEFGAALSLPIITALIAGFGWRASFVITGFVGLVWALAWYWFYRHPSKHSMASPAEVEYIRTGGQAAEAERDEPQAPKPAVPWRQLLRHSTIWGMVLAYVCRAFVIYFFITWYPSYLVDARGMTLLEMGVLGTIPGIVAIAADWGGGLYSDYLVRRGTRLSLARKIPLVCGMLGASVIGFAGLTDSTAVALTLLTIAYASVAFATGAVWSLPADVAPSPGNVASIGSLQNFGSQVGGITSPIVVGVLLSLSGGSYVLPMIAIGCVTVIGALIYAYVVEVEPLPVGERAR